MSEPRILCVDDEEAIRRLLVRVLRDGGYRADAAATVSEARAALATASYPLVLCDVALERESGLDLIREIARTRPGTATMMVTGQDDPGLVELALELGAYGYLVKPFEPAQLLIDVSGALKRRESELATRTELERARLDTLHRLALVVEARDSSTGEHVERVGRVSGRIAEALGLSAERVAEIAVAAPLHDVGKIGIPDGILRKPGPLNALERAEIERHAELGRDLLGGSGQRLLDVASTIAWTHHERVDGSGYPRGLVGEEIPLEGRIAAVADVFDALTSVRPYRDAHSVEEAVEHIRRGRGRVFDSTVVDAFLGVAGVAQGKQNGERA